MSKSLSILLALSLLSGLSACNSQNQTSPEEEEAPAVEESTDFVLLREDLEVRASSESSSGAAYNAIDGDLSTAWCPIEGDLTRSLTFLMPEGFSFDENNNLVTISPGFQNSGALIQSIDVWYDSFEEPVDILSFEESARPQDNDLPIGAINQMEFQITATYAEDENTTTPCIPEIHFPAFWGDLGSSLQR